MKKIITIIVCILLVAVVIAVGFIATRPLKNDTAIKTLKVNEVTRSVFYAPQYVAIANGFFEEEGLKIELTTGQGADNVMTAVLAGQCDIGFCGPEASIYVYNEGKEDYVEVFAQLTKRDGSFLVSKNKTDNFSWQDLKGKTVIPGRKGGVPYMTFEYVLKQNGLNPETDLVLDDSIKFDLMAGAFAGGNAEYVTLFEPTASMTEAEGKGYVVASVGEASGEVPYTAYCAKKSYIEKNPEIIQKFTNAIQKGLEYVNSHTSAEIAKTIKPQFKETDEAALTAIVERYKAQDTWKTDTVFEKESFDLLQNILEEAGELPARVPYEDLVTTDFARAAVKE